MDDLKRSEQRAPGHKNSELVHSTRFHSVKWLTAVAVLRPHHNRGRFLHPSPEARPPLEPPLPLMQFLPQRTQSGSRCSRISGHSRITFRLRGGATRSEQIRPNILMYVLCS